MNTVVDVETLAHRMQAGRLPVSEALRLAMILAESMRRLHDDGQAHGGLTPSHVNLTATGLEVMPAATVTPYTAPEMLHGHLGDARSDIFALGAILFEMFTGRRAFEGEDRAVLAHNLADAPTPGSGSPRVDRVVGPCLAKNAAARPRVQKVIMELRLLGVAARRAAPRAESAHTGAWRSEMQELEARMETRLASQLEGQLEAVSERILARVDRSFHTVSENMAAIERTLDGMRAHAHEFEQRVAADLVDIEQNIKVQSAAIESARTAVSQTDDLVERVVEAVESLQSAVLEPGETAGEHSAFDVN
jgi:eukaryotic-like serine/threonine-protein kinase